MNVFCFNCGGGKSAWDARCETCRQQPHSDEEIALSLRLTERFTPHDQLLAIVERIRAGAKPNSSVLANLLSSLKENVEQEKSRVRKKARSKTIAGAVLAIILIAGVAYLVHPWPAFKIAKIRDDIASYESYLVQFPSGEYAEFAQHRLHVLREPVVWNSARSSDRTSQYKEYLRLYPNGKFKNAAKGRLDAMAEENWRTLSNSRSKDDLEAFMRQFPSSPFITHAQSALESLRTDFSWVKDQDNIDEYQAFLAKFPSSPKKNWIEKRIIDLEVDSIAAGDHGELPPPVSVGRASNSGKARVLIQNKTGYELTVRYSGQESRKIVLPKGSESSVHLTIGPYRIAASVDAFGVRNFYGTNKMAGGVYQSKFYIETSVGAGSGRRRGRSSSGTSRRDEDQ